MKILLVPIVGIVLLCGCLEEKTETVYINRYTEVMYFPKDNSQPHELTISDVSWSWEETYLGGRLTVLGKVKNTGTVELAFVTIYSKALDENNVLISSDDTYIGTLNIQGEDSWEILDFDCKTNPTRVSIGYSYEAEILVSPKRIF